MKRKNVDKEIPLEVARKINLPPPEEVYEESSKQDVLEGDKILRKPFTSLSPRKVWTKEELLKEAEKVQEKKSNLSRSRREWVLQRALSLRKEV